MKSWSPSLPVRLGVLCKTSEAPSERRSWARQGYGPTRLRRLSDRLIAELGEDFELESDAMEIADTNADRRASEPLLAQLEEVRVLEDDETPSAASRSLRVHRRPSPPSPLRQASRGDAELQQQEERQRQRA